MDGTPDARRGRHAVVTDDPVCAFAVAAGSERESIVSGHARRSSPRAEALCDEIVRDYVDRYCRRGSATPQPFSRISPRATKKRPATLSRTTMAGRP